MKNLLLVLLLVSFLASCDSQSVTSTSRDVPFRAKSTWISTVSFNRVVSDNIEIVYADSAFRAGDTVSVDVKNYILQERVQ